MEWVSVLLNSDLINVFTILLVVFVPAVITAGIVSFIWQYVMKTYQNSLNNHIRSFVQKHSRGRPGFLNSLFEQHLDPRFKGHKDEKSGDERKELSGLLKVIGDRHNQAI